MLPAYEGNKKWRAAQPNIEISDEGLSPFKGRFASLEVNDFLNYLESRGTDEDVRDFVKVLGRELAWAYDNWAKALRDNNPGKLLGDMLNGAFENEAAKRYLADYARANNLTAALPNEEKKMPWQTSNGAKVEEVAGEMRVVQGSEQVTQ